MSLPVPKKNCDECRDPMKYCGSKAATFPDRWIQIGECKNSACEWYLKQMPMKIIPRVIE